MLGARKVTSILTCFTFILQTSLLPWGDSTQSFAAPGPPLSPYPAHSKGRDSTEM